LDAQKEVKLLVNREKLHINVNDKDIEYLLKENINDNDRKYRRAKLCSDKEAESSAERYIKLLNAPECRNFFLKVMYHLPYESRERILEASKKEGVRTPKKYFTYCAKRELTRLGF
jgi:hypothetical protein